MIWLTLLLFLLVVTAWLAAREAARESKSAGLPAGELLYSDTGRPVGRVAGTEVGRDGKRQEKPLVSETLELVGRPDYLIEAEGGVVPVEVKSTA